MNPVDIYEFIENFRLTADGKKAKTKKTIQFLWSTNKVNSTIKTKIVNIFSFINSSHYTFEDVKARVFLYYIHTEGKNIWYAWDALKDFPNAKENYFSKKQISADKVVIIELSKKLKLNSIESFFRIEDGGECYAYVLLKNKYISPIFYMKYMDYITEEQNSSKRQKRVNNMMKIIQGVKNGN